MIRTLLVGTLYGDPQTRTSQTGKTYTTAKVRADSADGAQVWCSLIAFADMGERLATLKAGAAISVSGRCKLSAWTGKDGQPNAGLDLVVDEIATLRGKPRSPQEGAPQRQQTRTRPHCTPARPAPPVGAAGGTPFDDLDDWQP